MTEPRQRDDDDLPSRQENAKDNSPPPSAAARTTEEPTPTTTTTTADSHPWQAVWDATRGAWYFWNAQTGVTTWDNPLQGKGGEGAEGAADQGSEQPVSSAPATEEEADQPAASAPLTDEEVALACGIDPDLSFLDPRMYAAEIQQARARGLGGGGASSSTTATAYTMAGAFDSRTGRFVPQAHVGPGGLHDPSRLAHAAQADRQMGAFFDVDQYREQRKRDHDAAVSAEEASTDADGRVKRRAPTKKELKQYKERAKEKKVAKHAWLRS